MKPTLKNLLAGLGVNLFNLAIWITFVAIAAFVIIAVINGFNNLLKSF